MANFCCSIEFEPRTLKQGQITHAREIAVDIAQKKEPDEASTIFNEMQVLKPVVGIKETAAAAVLGPNPPHMVVEECSKEVINGQINMETCCQCSSSALAMEPSAECRVKEPLSAPF